MQPTLHHATQDPPLQQCVHCSSSSFSFAPHLGVCKADPATGVLGQKMPQGKCVYPIREWETLTLHQLCGACLGNSCLGWAFCLSLNSYSYFWFLRQVMGCDADLNTSSQLKRLLKESSGPKGHNGLCSNSQHPIAIPSTQPVWEPSDSPISRKGFASTSQTPLALQ